MAKPARKASQTAGKANMKMAATKMAQKGKPSQKGTLAQKAKAKDNNLSATTNPSPSPKTQQSPKHKAAQVHTAAASEADTHNDSLHSTIAHTTFEKPQKIHFTATTGPPPNPAYFISERRTYRQRVRKQIAAAEERDKRHYSQKAEARNSSGPIKLPHYYWLRRFGGFAIHRENYVTYFEFAHTNVAWEDELVKIPFGERNRCRWGNRPWWRSDYFKPVERPVWWWEEEFMMEDDVQAHALAGNEDGAIETGTTTVAAHEEDESNKIHFTHTTGPEPLPAYFISERRTYFERLEKRGPIKMTILYWASRFGGAYRLGLCEEYVTYFEFAHTYVAWEDRLAKVPFHRRCPIPRRSTWFTPGSKSIWELEG